jgi:hypothetical protein
VNGQLNGSSNRKRIASPSMQTTTVVFVALFVLFLWLNFVMAEQIESRGRAIQVKTEELRTIERQQKALLKEISVAGSEQRMAEEAKALGYRPQTPIYLAVAQPLAQSRGELVGSEGVLAAVASKEQEAAPPAYSLLDMLARRFKAVETSP